LFNPKVAKKYVSADFSGGFSADVPDVFITAARVHDV
jgi:hypothetical protein